MSASAGRVMMIPQGDYSASQTYNILDVVSYNGSSYVAKRTTVGNAPTDTTYWQPLADISAKMDKSVYDSNNDGVVDNAERVNNHTVEKDVPADAQFTDTKTLSDLTDTDINNPADGETLVYNSTTGKFENGESSGGVGKDLTGQRVQPEQGTTVTAGTNAEIFNDYRARTFDETTGAVTAGNVASDDYTHAEGALTTASNTYAHAEGYGTTAKGYCSHVEGNLSTASGQNSHAEGTNTKASGIYSHAEGQNSTASGGTSHAEGSNTTASGSNSHAENYYTTASGKYSHAEGNYTTASGDYSHAEGNTAKAIGNHSHAEGDSAKASGIGAHAEGKYTEANGDYSHAGGQGISGSTPIIAPKTAQFVHGQRINKFTFGSDTSAGDGFIFGFDPSCEDQWKSGGQYNGSYGASGMGLGGGTQVRISKQAMYLLLVSTYSTDGSLRGAAAYMIVGGGIASKGVTVIQLGSYGTSATITGATSQLTFTISSQSSTDSNQFNLIRLA